MMTRRKLLQAGALAAVGSVAATAHARTPQVRVRHHRVPWPTRRRVRVVHLTDIHVGWSTPSSVLAAALRATKRVRPDLVVLTGDYVNHSMNHADVLRRFVRALPGPVVATLGNHDHWTDGAALTGVLEEGGATVLANQSLPLRPGGSELTVIGIDDARTQHHDVERAFHRVDDPGRALVLSHDPSATDQITARGGRLVLSGHTHGGQVRIPKLTDALGRAAGQPYIGGWYDVGPGRLYVNAGLGHSRAGLRVGAGAAAEVSVFDLVPATTDPTKRGGAL